MLRYRKGIAALLAVLVAVLCAAPAWAVTPEDYDRKVPQLLEEGHLYAEAAMLIDAESGTVLLEKNARARMYPASTTKIMTLMLALESGIDPDTQIIIPQQAGKVPGDSSLVPVFPGDSMTFRDLLYGFMLTSGNDGANAVAVLVAGSLEAFADRMNRRAEALGCTDTHFVNAHGYHDDDHYSTARDLALITREALKSDMFRQIVATPNYAMSIQRNGESLQNRVNNTNVMLRSDSSYYYADCIGIKTGSTSRAGSCFVGAAERDGARLISVDLHCAKSADKWRDTIRLFNYGFTRFTPYTLDQMFEYAGAQIARVRISNAIASDPYGGSLDLAIAQISNPDYQRLVPSGNEEVLEQAVADFVSRAEVTITDDMVAPVSEGEIMGRFRYVTQDGEEITALLVASRSVEKQPAPMGLSDLIPALRVFEDPLVRVLAVVLACLAALLILSSALYRARKARRRRRIYEERRQAYLREQRMRQRARAQAGPRRAPQPQPRSRRSTGTIVPERRRGSGATRRRDADLFDI